MSELNKMPPYAGNILHRQRSDRRALGALGLAVAVAVLPAGCSAVGQDDTIRMQANGVTLEPLTVTTTVTVGPEISATPAPTPEVTPDNPLPTPSATTKMKRYKRISPNHLKPLTIAKCESEGVFDREFSCEARMSGIYSLVERGDVIDQETVSAGEEFRLKDKRKSSSEAADCRTATVIFQKTADAQKHFVRSSYPCGKLSPNSGNRDLTFTPDSSRQEQDALPQIQK
ncbi:MAG TPA: hypothetical protein VF575_05450 [Candidatus Saccharimonadales bacterium]|jgi:hypothetical protein